MSKSVKFLTRAGAVLAAAALLAGCASGNTGEAPTEEPNSNEPIKVGLTLGLTGIYSGPSVQYKAAYEYWVDEVNAGGGLLGRDVELILYDDESNPTVAQQLYQRLVNEDNADLLLAPYTTAVGGAILPITERSGKVLWDGGFVGKSLHSTSNLIVSGWPYQDVEYARGMFEFWDTLPEAERPKTIALLTGQNPFTLAAREGFDGKDGVLGYAAERGMEIVLDLEYDQTATDLTSLVQRAKDSGADALIALSLPNDGGLIASTVNQLGYNPDFYCQCGSQVTSYQNWPDLGDAALNVFANVPAWSHQDTLGMKGFADFMFKEFDTDLLPGGPAAGYVATQVMQQAVEATKSLDGETLREYVANNKFDTIVGEVSYNEDGTIDFQQLLMQFHAEEGNVTVWPDKWKTGDAIIPLLAR